MKSLLILCGFFALALPALADITRTPGSKPKLSTKDFRKDQDKNGFIAPEARASTANFVSGMSVDVMLDADTAYLGLVKFTIRDQPQHGKLSEVRPHPTAMNKAIVTYIHDAASGQLIDRFTFVAKFSDGNASAPAVVSLVGRRADPIIEVVKQPLFKRIEPGAMDKGLVTLRNRGYSAYSQDITWPPPWQGPPRIELNVGEQRDFLITVRPPTAGAYTFEKDLQTDMPSSHLKCYVECVQAFVVTPGTIDLVFDPATGTRKGMVQVTNSSDSALKLAAQMPGRLRAVNEVSIEPKKTYELTIHLDDADVTAFRGELWLVQEPHREKIIVSAAAEPAQVKVISPSGSNVDLGTINKGSKGEFKIALQNVGGSPAQVDFTVPPPFKLLPDADPEFGIEPTRTREWTVAFAPEQAGNYETRITIDGSGSKQQLLVKATLFDPTKPAAVVPVANPKAMPPTGSSNGQAAPFRPKIESGGPSASNAPPKAQRSTSATSSIVVGPAANNQPRAMAVAPISSNVIPEPTVPSGQAPGTIDSESLAARSTVAKTIDNYLANHGIGVDKVPELRSPTLKRIEQIGAVDATPNSVTIGWLPPADAPPKNYTVETATRVIRSNGLSVKTWVPVKDWESVKVADGVFGAKLANLAPLMRYEFRVLGMDNEGRYSPASDVLNIMTPAPARLPSWVWSLLIALIGITAIIIIRRAQQGHWQRR